ncbi:hypothetical protein ACFO25_12540 [Paenactinomyces guangxiensis]|uniref:Uncharacterized protein n=1 Tax=Paenactinomyces guangxiensis TaxID=1490290 RepID=A0A7W1WR57_9BACL|nr:hypothetical protein [Paenactinomyces guangxiensis]MBA4494560.1 hypothetical protein [Paenactinomyces guangxiensis]MBH8591677.1 hypothetical protein [Paenactinomyces guangxiensis]
MTTVVSSAPIAKEYYYHLLEASYQRAKRILEEMEQAPEKYSPEKMRETIAYVSHLKKEMEEYKI